MSKRHLPSIEALTANDDERLLAELRISDLREHAAELRELLDEVEGIVRLSEGEQTSLDGQRQAAVVEDLAKLGCKIVELAGALTKPLQSPTSATRLRPWAPGVTH